MHVIWLQVIYFLYLECKNSYTVLIGCFSSTSTSTSIKRNVLESFMSMIRFDKCFASINVKEF
jgi:hypothetical protein